MRLLIVFLFLLVGSASAADYSWSGRNASGTTISDSSASGLCTKIWNNSGYRKGQGSPYLSGMTPSQAVCNYSYLAEWDLKNDMWTTAAIYRSGTTCPTGTTYNTATGGCDAPLGSLGDVCEGPLVGGMPSLIAASGQCARWDVAGKDANCKYLSGTGTSFTDIWIAFDGDGNPETPQAEKLGCAVNILDTAQCKMPVPKCESGICTQFYVSKCKVAVSFTGETAGPVTPNVSVPLADGNGAEGVCPPGIDCTVPEEPVVKDSKPCNYMSNGSVVGCESSEFVGNPGEMNCGTVNGGSYTCTKKVPTSTGVDIATKITTEPQADGNTKQTKEDKHTKTICAAPGTCTTQVTNNKSVTIKGPNGETISESSTCTGANCSTGKGEKGNCEPGKECEGEDDDTFEGPQNDEVPGFGESLSSFVDKVKAAPVIAGVSAIRMPSGGSCSMGSAQTMIGSISGDSVCQNSHWLDSLYVIFLAMGALAAVRVLMSA